MKKQYKAILQAVAAAALFGISSPISKILLEKLPPTLLAALLYLGAGVGMLCINLFKVAIQKEKREANLTGKDWPFIGGMILLDIAAPIFLMIGLSQTTASTASLLNNFEIVTTVLIASLIFKENIGKKLWIAISLITLSSIILSVKDFGSLTFSMGSIFVLLACVCWGFENNCTRMLSLRDPMQVVVIKGFGSGLGTLIIAFSIGQYSQSLIFIAYAMILGFFAYGLSIFFYVSAQRELGAARTSAYYAVAPFIGMIIALAFLHEPLTPAFFAAVGFMLVGTYFAVSEKHKHAHHHEQMDHEHRHRHDDEHHTHTHDMPIHGTHSHTHTHEEGEHTHTHTPDIQHVHGHK